MGDLVCDEGREWRCISDDLCRLSPYASWLDQLNAWEITGRKMTVTSSAPTFTLDKPTDSYCTPRNIEYPADLVTELTLATGVTVENGQICATD